MPSDLSDNIPEYNKIQPNDDLTVIKAKLAAQEKYVNTKQQQENKSENEKNESSNGFSLSYKRYRYVIDAIEVMHPDITYDMGNVEEPGVLKLLQESVSAIYIVRMIDTMIQPVFELKIMLPPIIKQFIIDRKNEIKFRVRIQSVYSFTSESQSSNPDGSTELSSTENDIYDDIINDIFVTYTLDENDFGDRPLYEETIEVQSLQSAASNLSNYTEDYSLFLWKEGHVEALRKVINGVYSNSNISSVLIQCFNDYGIQGLLISPPDNQTEYGQIIIPPLHLMNLPKFIDENYGLYYRGSTFFYDFRCLYVLNKNGVCDAYEDGEYKRTIITITGSARSDTKRLGVSEDVETQEYYLFGYTNDMKIINPAKVNDVINGGSLYIIDSRNNRTSDLNNPSDDKTTHRIIEDKYGNSFNKGQYAMNILEENLKLSITFMDYNTKIFTPNKEFVFNFVDNSRYKYCGTYRLYSEKIGLKRNGTEFRITGQYNFTWKRAMDESERVSLTEKVFGPDITVSTESNETTKTEKTPSETPKPVSESKTSNESSDVTQPFDVNKDEAFKKKEKDTTTAVTDYKKPSGKPRPPAYLLNFKMY